MLKQLFKMGGIRMFYIRCSRTIRVKMFELACESNYNAAYWMYSDIDTPVLYREDVWNLALHKACDKNQLRTAEWIVTNLRDLKISWASELCSCSLLATITGFTFILISVSYADIRNYGLSCMIFWVYFIMIIVRKMIVYSDKNIQRIIDNELAAARARGNLELVQILARASTSEIKPEVLMDNSTSSTV
jgi:hypothetical protein